MWDSIPGPQGHGLSRGQTPHRLSPRAPRGHFCFPGWPRRGSLVFLGPRALSTRWGDLCGGRRGGHCPSLTFSPLGPLTPGLPLAPGSPLRPCGEQCVSGGPGGGAAWGPRSALVTPTWALGASHFAAKDLEMRGSWSGCETGPVGGCSRRDRAQPGPAIGMVTPLTSGPARPGAGPRSVRSRGTRACRQGCQVGPAEGEPEGTSGPRGVLLGGRRGARGRSPGRGAASGGLPHPHLFRGPSQVSARGENTAHGERPAGAGLQEAQTG